MLRPSAGAAAVSELLYVSKSIAVSPLRREWRQYTPVSRQQAIEPVAQPIVAAHSRQKPGVAGVERVIGKLLGIKAAGIVGDAGDLARRLPTEIGHHCDTAAIAPETVMELAPAAHMRQCVEGEGDIGSTRGRDCYRANAASDRQR